MKILKILKTRFLGAKGTFICCPKCGSPNVGFGETKKSVEDNVMVETYPVFCRECGAEGEITERWKR